jgi:hypothetical protein
MVLIGAVHTYTPPSSTNGGIVFAAFIKTRFAIPKAGYQTYLSNDARPFCSYDGTQACTLMHVI